jgi:ribosome-associated protein
MADTESTDGKVLAVTRGLQIPLSEFEFIASRSSGPGGQNVNKVSSKIQLRWKVLESPSLSDSQRAAIVAHCQRRITREGVLHVTSERYRDQPKNRADVLAKLAELLRDALTPETVRKKTRVPRRVKENRLQDKRRRSDVKAGRRRLDVD